MKKDDFSVTIWEEKNGQKSASQEYRGSSLDFALLFAGFLFCKKMIEIDCTTEGNLNVWYTNPKEDYLKKIKGVYITVLDESKVDHINSFKDTPFVVKGFGDEEVGTFPRWVRK